MDSLNRNILALRSSILKCDIYKEYKKQEAILKNNPELLQRVRKFRADNFRLQNESGKEALLQNAQQLSRESAELRRNPEVNAYLDAELALCRLLQKVCKGIVDGIEMDIPGF